MKALGVIPARYGSTRLPGKPLADICGKPMVWWVYQQAKKAKRLTDIIVATESAEIEGVCQKLKIPVMITSPLHATVTSRMDEVSRTGNYDCYVCINGDEPLIDPRAINAIVDGFEKNKEYEVFNIVSPVSNPVEVVDPGNLKVVCSKDGRFIYISRLPIPFPGGSLEYRYKKHIGIVAFTRKALLFYVRTPAGEVETIENIDLLRFIENGFSVMGVEFETNSLSVDTFKDLETVRRIIGGRKRD